MKITGNPDWRKSSLCFDGGCLEVARTQESVLLRRTIDDGTPTGDVLQVSIAEWTSFESAVRRGEFQDLLGEDPHP
jgi:hypothetical protein